MTTIGIPLTEICNATYTDAVYDTEKYVTDETGDLWNDAEDALYDGDYPKVVANLRKIWEIIYEQV
mgnify:CR=1 FL=1